MTILKIIAAKALNSHTLIIQFSNHEIKQYDITPLLAKTPFQLLKNPAFFKSFHIEIGGHALVWNEDIDLSEYELWRNGTPCPATSHTLDLTSTLEDSAFSIPKL
ncbi:MAG: DUF2442 domain-containing protein [Limnothrix sp. BL-A-16]